MSSPQAAAAPKQPDNPESIPSQGSSLSPQWIHAITNLLSHPLTSEPETCPEMDPLQRNP